jgi:maltase-glucoamylase
LFHEYAFLLSAYFANQIIFLISLRKQKKKRFPLDNNTYGIDTQFLVGPALLVTPVLEQGTDKVLGYFPPNLWYRYADGQVEHDDLENGKNITLDAGKPSIPLHVRGGFILPTQEPANNTKYSRMNDFGLIIAPNEENEARGEMFFDDGSSNLDKDSYFYATFFLRDNVLKMNIEHNTYKEGLRNRKLGSIRIFAKNPSKNLKFYVNDDTPLVLGNKLIVEDNQIIIRNLTNVYIEQFTKLRWTVEDIDKVRLDCSLQNQALDESACLKRGCQFDRNIFEPEPKCFIPDTVGGYQLDPSSSFQENYALKKADTFSLFGQGDIEELMIEVAHGIIKDPDEENNQNPNKPVQKDYRRCTNIKVRQNQKFKCCRLKTLKAYYK